MSIPKYLKSKASLWKEKELGCQLLSWALASRKYSISFVHGLLSLLWTIFEKARQKFHQELSCNTGAAASCKCLQWSWLLSSSTSVLWFDLGKTMQWLALARILWTAYKHWVAAFQTLCEKRGLATVLQCLGCFFPCRLSASPQCQGGQAQPGGCKPGLRWHSLLGHNPARLAFWRVPE